MGASDDYQDIHARIRRKENRLVVRSKIINKVLQLSGVPSKLTTARIVADGMATSKLRNPDPLARKAAWYSISDVSPSAHSSSPQESLRPPLSSTLLSRNSKRSR
jgi:hypothetical protein